MTPSEIALDFANALATNKWSDAHALLSEDLRVSMCPAALQLQFNDMMDSLSANVPAPDANMVHIESSLQQWPTKRPSDLMWLYVSIIGCSAVEGIALIIADDGGKAVIRRIEWGRP